LEILTNLPWPAIPRNTFEVCSNTFDLDVPVQHNVAAARGVLRWTYTCTENPFEVPPMLEVLYSIYIYPTDGGRVVYDDI
jgi:hypothetical protein